MLLKLLATKYSSTAELLVAGIVTTLTAELVTWKVGSLHFAASPAALIEVEVESGLHT